MAEEDGFEAVLARVAAHVGDGTDAPGPAIGDAIREFRFALDAATNMGGTGDRRDVWVLLDAMVDAVRRAYPGVICQEGCSGCCDSETAVFDVWPEEWARIAAHMATWEPGRRQAFATRFEATHGPRLRAYKLLGLIGHFEPVADRYWAARGYRCPFLVDGGRCGIYAVRPLACRMYGYFAVRKRWSLKPAVYACRMQTDYFETVPALHLPSLQAVTARLARLIRKPFKRARILPLWIERELYKGMLGR